MNRTTFIKKLRHHLKFLDKKELEEEVLLYINKIDKSKKSDTEVIESFGSMESIVEEVCKRHHLDYHTVYRQQNFLKAFYDDLVELGSVLRNSDGKGRTKIILDLLLLIVITCVLKVPFIFIRDLGDQLIEIVMQSNLTALALWGLFIEIIYVVLALLYFVRTFRKWFKNMEKTR